MKRLSISPQARLSFLYAVPIGLLGGLMGLGGAEFRLPVLAGPLGYPARQATPLNLAVSLATIVTAVIVRGRTLSLAPVTAAWPVIAAMIAGAVTSAFWGAGAARRASNEQLERVILVLLVGIGGVLMGEAFLPQDVGGLLPETAAVQAVAGVGFGLTIGLVSSMLGVAGGELIIPTLVLAFGLGVKAAGTASLVISLPTVLVGLARYARHGALDDRAALKEVVLPMSIGSVLGAGTGGLLVGLVPAAALKFVLGAVLIVSAVRIFRH
ncbi:MAG: sulfite exporter TauE/SafE family protein [Chloroflexi bacterium]|nr:MAG: sulfite exporter TauE/SafE family protein [Chloroflexota bacterium]